MTDISNDSLTQIEQLMLCVENDLSEPCLDTLWDEVKALAADRDEWKEVAGSLKASTEALSARLQELEATIEGWESLCDLRFDEAETWRKKAAELEVMQGVVKPLPRNNRKIPWELDWFFLEKLHKEANSYEDGSASHVAVEAIALAVEREFAFTTPPADAIAEAVKVEREACAYIALNACLVPPDGGSPTEAEAAVCDEAARRIRARGEEA
ncbi:hypothetical protein [Shimia sp.]|uniref:hypothetical protein n=1 Tax=Shimia sp. TaxID=1954381 RepID=UPI003BA9D784